MLGSRKTLLTPRPHSCEVSLMQRRQNNPPCSLSASGEQKLPKVRVISCYALLVSLATCLGSKYRLIRYILRVAGADKYDQGVSTVSEMT